MSRKRQLPKMALPAGIIPDHSADPSSTTASIHSSTAPPPPLSPTSMLAQQLISLTASAPNTASTTRSETSSLSSLSSATATTGLASAALASTAATPVEEEQPMSRPRRPRPKPINFAAGTMAVPGVTDVADGGESRSAAVTSVASESSSTGRSTPPRLASLGNGSGAVASSQPAFTLAPSLKFETKEQDLDTLEELGMGSGGTVFKVLHRAENTIMAKKIIHQIDERTSKAILRELQILNKCAHENIIAFYGAYMNQGELCICMEYMDVGSLEMVAKVAHTVSEPVIGKIAVGVLSGLAYLYDQFRIVHRDIKPSNILVNSRGLVKLCDFGVSGELAGTSIGTFVGTGAYMSPERIQGGKYNTQSDTWSLGLTLLELIIGRYPFNPEGEDAIPLSEFELLHVITNDPIPEVPRRTPSGLFSSECADFIRDMLIRDPALRPSPKRLLDHYVFVRLAKSFDVDMVGWARSFLEPNLDDTQKARWTTSVKEKRQSVMAAKKR